jgi:hypothetical protein
VIIGDEELAQKSVAVRNLENGKQMTVSLSESRYDLDESVGHILELLFNRGPLALPGMVFRPAPEHPLT